jgi:hypothetical protein
MEQALGDRRLLGRVQLGKQVEEMTGEVTQLVDHGRFPGELRFEAYETKGDALLTTKLVGQTFQTNMDKILDMTNAGRGLNHWCIWNGGSEENNLSDSYP